MSTFYNTNNLVNTQISTPRGDTDTDTTKMDTHTHTINMHTVEHIPCEIPHGGYRFPKQKMEFAALQQQDTDGINKTISF